MNETPGSYANALYTNGSSQGKINGWVGDTGLYAQPIATDRWTHLALKYDGTAAREYVDGSLVTTKLSPAAPTGTGPLDSAATACGRPDTRRPARRRAALQPRADGGGYRDRHGNGSGRARRSAAPPPPPPPPPADGLVASFDFEEASGSTVTDGTGLGHDGTISGAVRTMDGHSGKALTFDGSGDRVTVADHVDLDLTSAMTLEEWVLPTRPRRGRQSWRRRQVRAWPTACTRPTAARPRPTRGSATTAPTPPLPSRPAAGPTWLRRSQAERCACTATACRSP